MPCPRHEKKVDNMNVTRQQGYTLPTEANILSRKVTRSGHISYEGRPYFVSKSLAGRYIRLLVLENRLIVETTIPLRKEYVLGV
jgi:hypothetical protein